MPVSRLLVRPDLDATVPAPSVLGEIGVPLPEPRRGAAVETVLGPVGPIRAARWNAQLPASAVAPAALTASREASAISPKADATSS